MARLEFNGSKIPMFLKKSSEIEGMTRGIKKKGENLSCQKTKLIKLALMTLKSGLGSI